MREPDERSLSALFAPPREELHGTAGLLCGYSADPTFLEAALRRFTRVSPASRQARGSVDWTLMLDPAHAVLSPAVVPGLLQLHARVVAGAALPFACMHAKVALLGFGPARTGPATLFRLIVSTGNWTTTSARTQIELVWTQDIEVQGPEASLRHELWAVARFLTALLRHYQHGAPLTTRAEALLTHALECGRAPASRDDLQFIATLPLMDADAPTPLWPQIAARAARSGRRSNFLACGSGSFEEAEGARGESVLDRVVSTLQAQGTLTAQPERRVVANLDPRHRVVAEASRGTLTGWTLCRPRDPAAARESSPQRTPRALLHAKFLLLAWRRENNLTNALLYLGSGNFTWPGMVSGGGRGNVEAGVVLSTPEIDSLPKAERRLPLGRAYTRDELADSPAATLDDELDGQVLRPAPPICVFIVGADGRATPVWDELHPAGEAAELELLLTARTLVLRRSTGAVDVGTDEPPRSLTVRWSDHEYTIPCLTSDGEFQKPSAPPTTFDEWLDALLDFPATLNDPAALDDDDGDDGEVRDEGTPSASWATGEADRRFPARNAMVLVERLAERNGAVPEAQAADWLAQLREMLLRRVPEVELAGWRQLRVDFLTALKSPAGFAPDWKDTTAYCALIDDVNRAWHIDATVRLEPTDD